MPGNSMDIYGGNSSHIVVPAQDLCVVPDRKGVPLSYFAVIADAATSPYQAAMRVEVKPGDLTIIIGITGGLGVYAAQICRALGAKEVIGIARNPAKLKRSLEYGATHVISSVDKSPRDIRDELRAYCKEKSTRVTLVRRQAGDMRLRHAEERVFPLPLDGLRRRHPGLLGLFAQVLPRSP
jgi:6-hydroxycyclohex-1-ene-1-carbonyl-CoA dehydrogenase